MNKNIIVWIIAFIFLASIVYADPLTEVQVNAEIDNAISQGIANAKTAPELNGFWSYVSTNFPDKVNNHQAEYNTKLNALTSAAKPEAPKAQKKEGTSSTLIIVIVVLVVVLGGGGAAIYYRKGGLERENERLVRLSNEEKRKLEDFKSDISKILNEKSKNIINCYNIIKGKIAIPVKFNADDYLRPIETAIKNAYKMSAEAWILDKIEEGATNLFEEDNLKQIGIKEESVLKITKELFKKENIEKIKEKKNLRAVVLDIVHKKGSEIPEKNKRIEEICVRLIGLQNEMLSKTNDIVVIDAQERVVLLRVLKDEVGRAKIIKEKLEKYKKEPVIQKQDEDTAADMIETYKEELLPIQNLEEGAKKIITKIADIQKAKKGLKDKVSAFNKEVDNISKNIEDKATSETSVRRLNGILKEEASLLHGLIKEEIFKQEKIEEFERELESDIEQEKRREKLGDYNVGIKYKIWCPKDGPFKSIGFECVFTDIAITSIDESTGIFNINLGGAGVQRSKKDLDKIFKETDRIRKDLPKINSDVDIWNNKTKKIHKYKVLEYLDNNKKVKLVWQYDKSTEGKEKTLKEGITQQGSTQEISTKDVIIIIDIDDFIEGIEQAKIKSEEIGGQARPK